MMKIKIRGPHGSNKLELPDGKDTTVGTLHAMIESVTGIDPSRQRVRLADSTLLGLPNEAAIGHAISAQDLVTVEECRDDDCAPPEQAGKRARLQPTDGAEVLQLTEMGFPEQECRDALAACGGNLDHALARLLGEVVPAMAPAPVSSPPQSLRFLTYNLWFDPLEQQSRVKGLAGVIASCAPDFIALQEVTPTLFYLLATNLGGFLDDYHCSQPPLGAPYFTMLLARKRFVASPTEFRRQSFPGSQQGRDLVSLRCDLGGGIKLAVATSHLESALPPYKGVALGGGVRKLQLAHSSDWLPAGGDVIFGGDMNWDDGGEEGAPLLATEQSWTDAWTKLHPQEPGYTLDSSTNKMLGFYKRTLKKRLDRVFCREEAYLVASIRMVGTEALGPTFQRKVKGEMKTLPLYPSDHYGLVVEMHRRKE
eukprot:TRINITY_DN8968_c0_g2_i3.p1 TRINITY_DN8968_c0_g2~~TRINITY_DN8968_c0_g2_i3.p1  ORF type:complete len:423 (-),score=84.54 TRINITY_DN8968_c0_g2_i3:123-1391(-)